MNYWHDERCAKAFWNQHELPPSHGVHLYLDLAQHGLGSRSCGPDVRPEHALWPRPVSASVSFRVGS